MMPILYVLALFLPLLSCDSNDANETQASDDEALNKGLSKGAQQELAMVEKLIDSAEAATESGDSEKKAESAFWALMKARKKHNLAKEQPRYKEARDRMMKLLNKGKKASDIHWATQEIENAEDVSRLGKEVTGVRVKTTTDAIVASLSQLKQLKGLELWFAPKLTDQGLATLSRLTSLEVLIISKGSQITDVGVKSLAALKELRKLELGGNKMTDAGLEALTGLSALEELALSGTDGIQDAGLLFLTRLSKLTSLQINGCTGITEEGVKAFRAKLPGCKVRH